MTSATELNPKSGVLYIVSTPIGNREDITLRALRVLKAVDLIAAEDTRHTRPLLAHYDIRTPTTSYFEGNQIRKGEQLVARLKAGETIALVSDAGTPTISDPGYRLVVQCIEANIPIVPIPGVSACIVAASVAGLPLHNFVFEGFLSPKPGKRRRRLTEIQDETRTLIFYESPHRLISFLRDALTLFGDRRIVVARELTKKFEELFRGVVSEAIEKFRSTSPRGEFTLVIAGKDFD
ncbi:MAG: 16S rRNA (cytidine(1402)-2'-O)-methyltransferase [Candidatus Poribacteria bacterium]|nr:16S rRNA (cytidine(1402)-2'-O)-methyltransferase [Candidatus Poribacteria bacterium]